MDLLDWMQDKRFAQERRVIAISVVVIVLFATVYSVLIFTRPPDLVEPSPALRVPASLPDPEVPPKVLENNPVVPLITAGRLREATQMLDQQEAFILRLRGAIAWEEGNEAKAREAFEKAVQLAPGSALDLGHLAMVRLKQGDETEAIGILRDARALAPADDFLQSLHFLARLQAGQSVEVTRELEESLQVAPENTLPGIAMASAAVCLQDGRINDAVQFLNAAKSALPPFQFRALLAQEPLAKFADHPAIAAYYRKTP
jgi:tetratricopeptide (TPR) repeat protein